MAGGGIHINPGGQPPRRTPSASVEGKGKEPSKPTPEEAAALDKKIAKKEAKEWKEAMQNSIQTYKEELNKAAGIGTSGVAHEKPPSSPKAPNLRINTDRHSTNSSGTENFEGSLYPVPPDSPLPSWIKDRPSSDLSRTSSGFSHEIPIPGTPTSPGTPATRPGPMNFGGPGGSPAASEGRIIDYQRSNSDPGPSRNPGAASGEASNHPSPVNWGDLQNNRIRNQNQNRTEGFQTGGEYSPGRIVWYEGDKNTIHPRYKPATYREPVDIPPLPPGSPLNWDDFPVNVKSMVPPPGPPRVGPDPSGHTASLNDPIEIPGTPSSPGTPATRPGPGPLTFPDSPSDLSSQHPSPPSPPRYLDDPLPVTQHAQPRPPEPQDALANLSPKAKLAIAAATGALGGALLVGALTENGDSSQQQTKV